MEPNFSPLFYYWNWDFRVGEEGIAWFYAESGENPFYRQEDLSATDQKCVEWTGKEEGLAPLYFEEQEIFLQ